MEERTAKARTLVNRIESLNIKLKNIEPIFIKEISLLGDYSYKIAGLEGTELMKDIKNHVIEAIKREIERLEQELAEL
jgi:uncharacterized protein with gpF-like domain